MRYLIILVMCFFLIGCNDSKIYQSVQPGEYINCEKTYYIFTTADIDGFGVYFDYQYRVKEENISSVKQGQYQEAEEAIEEFKSKCKED